jgi:5-methyltetrahydropteroyltriglutamate--homocysteine methyltransferase
VAHVLVGEPVPTSPEHALTFAEQEVVFMRRSTGQILTTHTGSLPRPADLVAMLNAKELDEPYDRLAFAARVKRAIDEIVRKQTAIGIDVIGDGEHSKFNWMAYARARLEGLAEIDSPVRFRGATRDSIEFSGAYEDLKIMHGARSGTLVAKRTARPRALVCAGAIRYVGHDELHADIANLKASLQGIGGAEAFMTAISPSNLELYYENRHYASDEDYLLALGEAMRVEYLAITDAGFILQIDDPRMATTIVKSTPRSTTAASSSRCVLRRSIMHFAASRRIASVSTPATASTSRRACMTSSSSTSSI